MASIMVEPEASEGREPEEEEEEVREGREEGTESTEGVEEEPSSNSASELDIPIHDSVPTILKKDTSPYITIFLGTNFIGILLWSTIEKTFPWFIYISCPVAIVECIIYGLSKRMYFFITVSTYCNVTILLFMTYLAIGGAYPWFIFPAFTLAIFPIIHYLYLHHTETNTRYFMIHISMYILANVQIFFAWVIHSKKVGALPWFIYPWGGWGLLLLLHYNLVLMRNKNMMFVYMFLDVAGLVVITFRFTIGPIILLSILAFLVLLLIYQLCLKKQILRRVRKKQLRDAQRRRQQHEQELQQIQQQNIQQQNLQQQILQQQNIQQQNLQQQSLQQLQQQLLQLQLQQQAQEMNQVQQQQEQEQKQNEQKQEQQDKETSEKNSEKQRLISSSSLFSPHAEPIVLHPRRRRNRTITSDNLQTSTSNANTNDSTNNSAAIFALPPPYLLPSNYFHFEPPNPQPPPPITPIPSFIPPVTPVLTPTPFVAPQFLPIKSEKSENNKKSEKGETSDENNNNNFVPWTRSTPSTGLSHTLATQTNRFPAPLPPSLAPLSSNAFPPPPTQSTTTTSPISSPLSSPRSTSPTSSSASPSSSFYSLPTSSFTPFTPSTPLPVPPSTSPIPANLLSESPKTNNKMKPIYLVAPGSPQLKPKRKKLRQPNEGSLASSTDSATTKSSTGDDETLTNSGSSKRARSPIRSQSPNRAPSPTRSQSPTFSSPNDSDIDDIVVVESGGEGKEENMSSRDDFQM